MVLRARNASAWLLATLNAQSTCHGPRPGPTLAPWCSGGLPACPGAESTRKDPRPEEKKVPMGKKTHLYVVIYTLYTVYVLDRRSSDKTGRGGHRRVMLYFTRLLVYIIHSLCPPLSLEVSIYFSIYLSLDYLTGRSVRYCCCTIAVDIIMRILNARERSDQAFKECFS